MSLFECIDSMSVLQKVVHSTLSDSALDRIWVTPYPALVLAFVGIYQTPCPSPLLLTTEIFLELSPMLRSEEPKHNETKIF